MKKIILASSSPRRIELLKRGGIEFEVIPSDYDEMNPGGLEPKDLAMMHGLEKARDVLKRNPESIVIGADTIVVHDGKIFEKPESRIASLEMLRELNGTTHSVITGFAILSKEKEIVDYSETKIYFRKVEDELLQQYVETGRGLDKSGSYSIQDTDFNFVEKYEGDYDNVVGLPTTDVLEFLSKF